MSPGSEIKASVICTKYYPSDSVKFCLLNRCRPAGKHASTGTVRYKHPVPGYEWNDEYARKGITTFLRMVKSFAMAKLSVTRYAMSPKAAGSTTTVTLPKAPPLNPAWATKVPEPLPPLEDYTFEGYRNADGSVAPKPVGYYHQRALHGRRCELRG